jgi:hypothetical protein
MNTVLKRFLVSAVVFGQVLDPGFSTGAAGSLPAFPSVSSRNQVCLREQALAPAAISSRLFPLHPFNNYWRQLRTMPPKFAQAARLRPALLAGLLLLHSSPVAAGSVFQNFEPNNAAPILLNPVGSAHVSVVDTTERVHSGLRAVKTLTSDNWAGFGVQAQAGSGMNDLKQSNNDRLTFWTYALPDEKNDNNVGVTFYDASQYRQGFEVWTTRTARYGQWSRLEVLFSQLPPDFDLRHVVRLEFKNYWPGTYYFDDIQSVREDRVYQAFEREGRADSTEKDFGWKWNGRDTVALSAPGEPVHEGRHSWKLVSKEPWGGTGIQSQEKRYLSTRANIEQSAWHVDLDPGNNDRLTFWIYALPENKEPNTIAVQFFDNGAHFKDGKKVEIWTKAAVPVGHWTRMTVLFADLLKQSRDLNLRDINKIQFVNYWPGIYYFDDIRATGPQSQFLNSVVGEEIAWKPMNGAGSYELQQSLEGPEGPWQTVYSGPAPRMKLPGLIRSWFRVRWLEPAPDRNDVPYASDWSDIGEFRPRVKVGMAVGLFSGFFAILSLPVLGRWFARSHRQRVPSVFILRSA